MSTLFPRQMFLLDLACQPLHEWRGVAGVFLVGTTMQPRDGRSPRDVDVRMILTDRAYDRLAKAIRPEGIAFLGIAVGQYLAALSSLPVDFQIQRMTEATATHTGPRNPLGLRSMANFAGDTPVTGTSEGATSA